MKNQTTIALYKAQYARFLAIKAEAAKQAGRPLSWGEFLERLFEVYQASQGKVVEMRQEGHGAAEEAVFDEPMTLEVGAALGRPVYFSEETCDRIAESLAAKLGPALASKVPQSRSARQPKTRRRRK